MALLPPVLLHDAAVGGRYPQPPGLRAAFGEGSPARALLLELLPLRAGLLALRACSESCNAFVAEASLVAQSNARQIPTFRKPKGARAAARVFPAARQLNIEVNQQWTLEDLAVCHHPSLHVDIEWIWFKRPTIDAVSLLRYFPCVESVTLPTYGLVDACFKRLRDTEELRLVIPVVSSLKFAYRSFCLLRNLTALEVHSFGGRATLQAEDLAPISANLKSLRLHGVVGFSDLRSFKSLQTFALFGSGVCRLNLSTQPLALTDLMVSAVELTDDERSRFSPASKLKSCA